MLGDHNSSPEHEDKRAMMALDHSPDPYCTKEMVCKIR